MDTLKRLAAEHGTLTRADLLGHFDDTCRLTTQHLTIITHHVNQEPMASTNTLIDLMQRTDINGFAVFDVEADNFATDCDIDGPIAAKPWLARRAKATMAQLDSIFGYTGFLTGFQGFIINDYVNSGTLNDQHIVLNYTFFLDDDDDDVLLNNVFQIGFFCMVLSFCINMIGCLLTFFIGLNIRSGFFRKRYIMYTSVAKALAIVGTTSFTVAIMFMLYTIQLYSPLLYAVYATIAFFYVAINVVICVESRINYMVWGSRTGRKDTHILMDHLHS